MENRLKTLAIVFVSISAGCAVGYLMWYPPHPSWGILIGFGAMSGTAKLMGA